MNETQLPWYETIVMPALLRHSRTTYGKAMRRALEEAGYDDMPRNGMYIVGGLALGANTTVDVGLGTLTLSGIISGPFALNAANGPAGTLNVGRSEERRVGKECW